MQDPAELGGWPTAAGSPSREWRPAIVPGTVAQALAVDLDAPGDLDARDWWYRCRFPGGGERERIVFEGLATIADVWLNGERVLQSRNMFLPQSVEVQVLAENELVVCFRSVSAELAVKRPRPRWKTALVESQNLRWVRTTLLGRIPGWTPRVPAIGPWRQITVQPIGGLAPSHLSLQTDVVDGAGRVCIGADFPAGVAGAMLTIAGRAFHLRVEPAGGAARVSGEIRLPNIALWWPHTHGEPVLHGCTLTVLGTDGVEAVLDLGRIGFKRLAFEARADNEGLPGPVHVNGRVVFCRGACWTVDDIRSLDGAPEQLAETLRLCVAAGMNMLRVGGTMTYGSDAFYRLCDELGILVWQDFMFANMDYPFTDPTFASSVLAEVDAQLNRLQRHPCVAVYCGGSEIEQQAAMLGLPASEWSGPFFSQTLPARIAALHPGIPYFPSTPTGGPLPFHTSAGITHYYGVGAYRRPLSDVRRAAVIFTPECLGFSNVPDAETVALVPGGGVPHHPGWKAGVPRDGGAGWDFEDVRDHYLKVLYGLDPIELRSADLERYHALSRAVTAEVMLRVYAEWRRPGSGCGGALVWFLKDLRPGAGWGVIDSTNRPKSAWWAVRRAWAPRAVLLTDEGLDGVGVHLHNETAEPLDATLEVELLSAGRRPARVALATTSVQVAPWRSTTLPADTLLGGFQDLTYAYRFGPSRHDAVAARLIVGDRVVHEDVWFVHAKPLPLQNLDVLTGAAVADARGVEITLESTALLQGVELSAVGFEPEDSGFHLCPGRPRTVRFGPTGAARPFKLHVSALNLDGLLTLRA